VQNEVVEQEVEVHREDEADLLREVEEEALLPAEQAEEDLVIEVDEEVQEVSAVHLEEHREEEVSHRAEEGIEHSMYTISRP